MVKIIKSTKSYKKIFLKKFGYSVEEYLKQQKITEQEVKKIYKIRVNTNEKRKTQINKNNGEKRY